MFPVFAALGQGIEIRMSGPAPENRRPRWVGYAVVVVLEVVLDTLLKLVHPYVPLGEFAIPYVLIIMLAAYLFGTGPAILAFVIGFIGFDYYYTGPPYVLWPIAVTPRDWAGVATFLMVQPL